MYEEPQTLKPVAGRPKERNVWKILSAIFIAMSVVFGSILAISIYLKSPFISSNSSVSLTFNSAINGPETFAKKLSLDVVLISAIGYEYAPINDLNGENIIVQADDHLGDGNCRYWSMVFYSELTMKILQVSVQNGELAYSNINDVSPGNTYEAINTSLIVNSDRAAAIALINGGSDYLDHFKSPNITYSLTKDSETEDIVWNVEFNCGYTNSLDIYVDAVTGSFIKRSGWSSIQTPVGVFTASQEISPTEERLYFSTFNPNTPWSDCKLIVSNFQGNDTTTFLMSYSSGVVNFTAVTGNPDFFLTGTDHEYDGIISSGDYITMTRLGAGFMTGDIYRLAVEFIASGNTIADILFYR